MFLRISTDFTSCWKNQIGVKNQYARNPWTKRDQAIEPLGSTAGFAGAVPANGGRRGVGQSSDATSDSPGVEPWDVWMWTDLRRWPVATRGSVARACSGELSANARVRAGWAAPLVPNQQPRVLRGEGGGGAGQEHCGGGNGDGGARRRVCVRNAEAGEVYLSLGKVDTRPVRSHR
jgi:hypothetical protein